MPINLVKCRNIVILGRWWAIHMTALLGALGISIAVMFTPYDYLAWSLLWCVPMFSFMWCSHRIERDVQAFVAERLESDIEFAPDSKLVAELAYRELARRGVLK